MNVWVFRIALMHVYVTQANFTTKPRFEIKNKRSFTEMNSQGSRVEKNTHAQKVQMQKILFTNEACWWNLLVWRNHAYGLLGCDITVRVHLQDKMYMTQTWCCGNGMFQEKSYQSLSLRSKYIQPYRIIIKKRHNKFTYNIWAHMNSLNLK